jgi:monoamine oxidase
MDEGRLFLSGSRRSHAVGPFLNRPFHERLVFAGEHCCLPFFGYMEGALQSGLAAASAIVRNEGLI